MLSIGNSLLVSLHLLRLPCLKIGQKYTIFRNPLTIFSHNFGTSASRTTKRLYLILVVSFKVPFNRPGSIFWCIYPVARLASALISR